MLEKQRMQAMYRNLADGGVLFVKQRIQAALRYYKSHIWIEITASVLLISAVLLLIFYFYLRSQLFVYVIREDDTIVSCAFLLIVMKPISPAFINGKTATILNVYTLPAYRRRGYARMLMNAMITDAKELNIDVIELKATEDGYDLYRSVGFEDDRSKYHLMKWKAQREA